MPSIAMHFLRAGGEGQHFPACLCCQCVCAYDMCCIFCESACLWRSSRRKRCRPPAAPHTGTPNAHQVSKQLTAHVLSARRSEERMHSPRQHGANTSSLLRCSVAAWAVHEQSKRRVSHGAHVLGVCAAAHSCVLLVLSLFPCAC